MIIIIIVLIIIIFILAYLNIKSQNDKSNEIEENKIDNEMPYIKKYLLTKNEWVFYKKIKPICDNNNLHIISKVRLADIVEVKKGLSNKEWHKYFNKIKNKHIDFILCNPENLAIIALIELDDKSHERISQQESDIFKNKLFDKVGYKFIRVKQYDDFKKKLIENKIINETLEQ